MPGRSLPLVNDQVYHIFNRGIDHRPTFHQKKDFQRALAVMQFYKFASPPIRFSYFLETSLKEQEELMTNLVNRNNKLVEIIAFCFMPNHFHFLIKQQINGGISKFLSNFQNSYTRFHNVKYKRLGPLFLNQFKAVRIETEEQLVHITRYIHLNPYTSFVVKTLEDNEQYPWSSLKEYLSQNQLTCNSSEVISFFSSPTQYSTFVREQADYQRRLKEIEHLLPD